MVFNWAVQEAGAGPVIKTLNEVLAFRVPVGKEIKPPVPETAEPMFVFPLLFLN